MKWLDDSKMVAMVTWRTIPEWVAFLSQWAQEKNMKTIMTLPELLSFEEAKYEDFVGMDEDLLAQILIAMEQQGKCALVRDSQQKVIAFKFI